MLKKIIKNQNGFTVLELTVAVAIFAILSLAVSWLVIRSWRSNAVIWEQLTTQNDGRKAVKQVVDDVRRAEESSLGSFPIVLADDYELAFYANIDNDSIRERVRFWLDDSNLKKGIIEPTGNPLQYDIQTETEVIIASDVVNTTSSVPVFSYYDSSYTGEESAMITPANITDLRVVKVQLELEKDPTETPVPLHVESTVQIRNLKDN